MAQELGAILVAEIGSVTTRVVLVDVVEGEMRLINQVEKPSSVEPPYRNATIAILEAAAHISELTGRRLLREGQLLMPQNDERDGVNHVIATTSAAGTLSFIITAVASDISARSGLHACRSTYTSILQIITLDDFDKNRELSPGTTSSSTISWIERQIETMLTARPDVVLITGGLEGGAVDILKRLAHMVALTTARTSFDTSGQLRQDTTTYPVIFAGNSEASDQVGEILRGRAETIVVDNVRPSLEREHLEPARQEIHRLYLEEVLPKLPGFQVLRTLCETPLTTVCHATGLMTRFLAERYQRQVLALDIGSSSSSLFLAHPGRYTPIVLGNGGTGYSITTVLVERGFPNIMRWLPFSISEKDLLHWMLNKLMRPHRVPFSREDILLEHAIAREALTLLLHALSDECPETPYDLVIAGGGVLAHAPHPGLAALTLLDVLQPTAEESGMALDLHLDTLGLLPAGGTLARMEPDAAVTVCDRDLMHNTPLATCIIALGSGRAGKPALEASLTTTRGSTYQVRVNHGQIARIPLPQGTRGQITLRPAGNVRIGRNAPGVDVRSDLAAIGGSALGIIIDARGRPLRLPESEQQRQATLWEWLVALGVEQGGNPYIEAAAAPEAPVVRFDKGERLAGESTASLEGILEEPTAPAALHPPAPPPPPLPPPPPAATPGPPAPVQTPRPLPTEEGAASPPPPPPQQKEPLPQSKRISLGDLDVAEPQPPAPPPSAPPPASAQPAAPSPGSLEDDLASLRQTVEQPEKEAERAKKKKGGLFGKKKK